MTIEKGTTVIIGQSEHTLEEAEAFCESLNTEKSFDGVLCMFDKRDCQTDCRAWIKATPMGMQEEGKFIVVGLRCSICNK